MKNTDHDNMTCFLVGGHVRDHAIRLLRGVSHPPVDKDHVVIGATRERMLEQGFLPIDAVSFPIFLHPETKEEYALARSADGDFHPGVTLEEDLSRRDFTINAMALDDAGEFVDPLRGLDDIRNGIIRQIEGAFAADPIRVLRLARFQAQLKDFSIAPETLSAAREVVANGGLDRFPPERVFQEFRKGLAGAHPDRFIKVLRDSGALAKVLPEVENLFGVPQRADYHPEVDTGVHILLALKVGAELRQDPRLAFAILVHDVGKGVTPDAILPRHVGHEEAGVDLVRAACARLRIPSAYQRLALKVTRYHLHMHRLPEMRANSIVKLLENLGAFANRDDFELFISACEADARGRDGLAATPYPQGDLLRRALTAAAKITGTQIIAAGHAPGPGIGKLLHQARVKAVKQSQPGSKPDHKGDP